MNNNIIYFLIIIIILSFSLVFLLNKTKNEKYVQEFTGNNRSCSQSYRSYYMNQSDDINQKDRCKFCKGYNNIQYESYCPHNCRDKGVSLCDQGSIL